MSDGQENNPVKQPLPRPLNIFQEEWPVVSKAKKSFFLVAIASFCFGALAIFGFYQKFVIPDKDSTIKRVETDSDSYKDKLADAQQNLDRLKGVNLTQWHLKLNSVRVIPNGNSQNVFEIPFRIEVLVNNVNFSSPSGLIFFKGDKTMAIDDKIPLPVNESKFEVRFASLTSKELLMRNPRLRVWATNVLDSISSTITTWNLKDLPAIGHATVPMPISLSGQDQPPAIIEIDYEISKD